MNMNTNILFYSKSCETCKTLLTVLKNENLLGNFKLICVDDTKVLPTDLTRVPTMLVININRPLVAQETFEWVSQMKFLRQQQIMDINKKIIQQNTTYMANNKKGPIGYDSEIMGSFSDKFAFANENKNDPFPQSFIGIGDEDKNVIFTAPQEKDAISKTHHSKLIKEIEERRSVQDNDHLAYAKQIQMELVMKAENEKLMQQYEQQNSRHM
jgi:hypothetical protein